MWGQGPYHHLELGEALLALVGSQHCVRGEQRATAERAHPDFGMVCIFFVTGENNEVVNIFWFYCKAQTKARMGKGWSLKDP